MIDPSIKANIKLNTLASILAQCLYCLNEQLKHPYPTPCTACISTCSPRSEEYSDAATVSGADQYDLSYQPTEICL